MFLVKIKVHQYNYIFKLRHSTKNSEKKTNGEKKRFIERNALRQRMTQKIVLFVADFFSTQKKKKKTEGSKEKKELEDKMTNKE